MATKDFAIEKERSSGVTATKDPSQLVASESEPKIKNAHATGDGSYGRSDESLPDEQEPGQPHSDNAY